MRTFKPKRNFHKNNFINDYLFLLFTVIVFQTTSVKCQNMPGTKIGTTGINHIPFGWYNASLNGGTPDLSTAAFCILPNLPWNVSPTNSSTLILPNPSTGDSIFADVYTGYSAGNNVEIIGTTITDLIPGNTYTIKIYLLAGISLIGTTTSPNPSPFVYFPTSVDVTINGITSVILLDSTNHNKWKLFTIPFTANADTATFKIGNPKPQPINSFGGGFVCISIGENAISCSNNKYLGADTTLCYGDTLRLDAAVPNSTYLWQDSSVNSTYSVTSTGIYSVIVSGENCWSTDTIRVDYKPLPSIRLGNDTTLCNGEKFILDATTSNASYMWQDGTTNSRYTVNRPGLYWARLTINNCSSSDSVNVLYRNCNCVPSIPNAITPNGDGINDRWIISQNNCINRMNVSVYNRYGRLVYHSDDYQNDWEGRYNSKPCPDATYYYVVRIINSTTDEQTYKGNITILR